jgi:hypothetical protein
MKIYQDPGRPAMVDNWSSKEPNGPVEGACWFLSLKETIAGDIANKFDMYLYS